MDEINLGAPSASIDKRYTISTYSKANFYAALVAIDCIYCCGAAGVCAYYC